MTWRNAASVVGGLLIWWLLFFAARQAMPALVLAGMFLVYMVINHYVIVRDQLPP